MYCGVPTTVCAPVSAATVAAPTRRRIRAGQHAGARRARQLGQTEVEQLDPLLREQDVGGLQIAVDDALAVRGVERLADLHAVRDRLVDRQRAGDRLARR